jgi:HAE1 family hydrophobic/amphiphilic exporter-1
VFVNTFIRRPILASVCSLVIILAGLVAIPTMPVAQYPPLAPPQISVNAIYTGANAQEVESAVTTPLEQAINGVEGMLYMTSSSTNSGFCSINVTFDITRDQDLAQVDVQNRVSQALGRLPTEVRTLGVTVNKQNTGFVMAAGVYAEHGEYDSLFLSNYIDVYVKDALKRVPGVADVTIFGERKYSMRLWLDPLRLAARQITANDVTNALREQNVQVAAGALGQAPAPQGQMYQLSVRVEGRLPESTDFDNIILKAGEGGSLVRLKDVGHAELGAETYASELRFQAQDAVGFGVIQLPSANALDVSRVVKAELVRLEKGFPPGLKYQIALDTTEVVSDSIREVLKTLAEAIVLVVIVIFVFLQTWRSTIIPTITIPVSLVGAFAFINLMGYSINTLTLFGIILATGIVVDDAIVVIENIERHIQEFKVPAHKAAVDAMGEVLGAVIATALVLIAVFVPIAFFPGTTGRLYAQFAMTIAFAVALSAFNALTLTPALAALLLDRQHHGKNRFFAFFERIISGGTAAYVAFIRRGMRSRWALVLLFFAALGLTYFVYGRVPQAFVPEEDQGYFITQVQAPAGSSLQYTGAIARKAEQIFAQDPDILAMFSVMGFSFSGAAPNQGIMFVRLKPFAMRKGASHSASAVIGRVMPKLMSIPGAVVLSFAPPSIPGLSRFGGFEFQVLDQTGTDINTLARGAYGVMGAANKSPLLRGVFTPFTANDPQVLVTIDRQKALASGLALGEITSAMQTFLGSSYVNDFQFNNRAYRVYVQADQQYRSSPKDLDQLYARSRTGQMIALDNVVTMKETTAPQVIGHFNLFRSATLNGSAAPGVSSGEALKEMERIATSTLPAGMSFAWSGISLEETKAGRQSVLIFGLALLLVYLTLAAQYESLVLPFIVLLGVPLAVLGALSAQWIRGLANDVYCQVGLVMLIGLSAKNAILIVEFAEQLRHRGLSIVDAAVEAGRIRLRPILMTSLAFILGVLPLVFAAGAGQEARHSVGTAVAGGMLLSTFLNIVFIPVLYVVIESLRERVAGEPTTDTKTPDLTNGATS